MGLLDKVKNLFTEEVEEEVPVTKEIKHVEIPNPRREVIKEEKEEIIEDEEVTENISSNREERFKFPVYFDDKDFEDLKKEEPIRKVVVEPKEEIKVEPYKAIKMVEEKKNFKPSPIISPVYGILDENYKKEDVVTKSNQTTYIRRNENVTVDDVRKKAYGTLEDELEDTLFGDISVINNTDNTTEIDIFQELENAKKQKSSKEEVDLALELERQKQKIEEINAFIKNSSPKEEEQVLEEALEQEENEVEEIKEDVIESKEEVKEDVVEDENVENEELDNGDLFNLIDSMYEKREEE